MEGVIKEVGMKDEETSEEAFRFWGFQVRFRHEDNLEDGVDERKVIELVEDERTERRAK